MCNTKAWTVVMNVRQHPLKPVYRIIAHSTGTIVLAFLMEKFA